MKRLTIIFLTIVALPLVATAQNSRIEELADRYADREGYSVTVIKGTLATGFSGSMDLAGIDISNIIRNISSIIVIKSDTFDEGFASEIERIIAVSNYRTITSASGDGERIRIMLGDVRGGGRDESASELVITVLGGKTNMMISVVGRYNLKRVDKTN